MASGSTETFASNSQPLPLPCFNTDLLNHDPDKYWSAEVMATASTGSFWEDDPEEVVKKKVNELRRKFHSGRQLQIKHLPRDVTEEEIRELLSDFPVQAVQLSCGTGSGMARALLEDPEMLEEWDRDRPFLLRGQRVPVQPTPTEMMLCVARLPLSFTETQFTNLVHAYGEVRRCFLMISDKSGDSKGYGFVEYMTKESALQAKNMLDGKQVENWILCCDWLDSSHITFDALHSKCLYVDRLPKDFRNMDEFRKVISSVVTPPYCQIALKNGCPQDWGLVEFSTSDDAENAQVALNGYVLRGQSIRMCYYIPGVRAINLYLKLLNDSGNKGKAAGLLPDPPAPAVFQQLQNLAKQNPAFAQSLQHIIWTQIQSLQGSGESPPTKNNSAPPQASKVQPQPNKQVSLTPNHPPPNITPPPNGPDKAQAALVILLAAQMQAQMGNNHPSLLGNPQMLATLQNIIKQGPPPTSRPPPNAPNLMNINHPMGPPPTGAYQYAHNNIDARKIQTQNNNNMKQAQYMVQGPPQKIPLLPNPKMPAMSPPPGEIAPSRPTYSGNPEDNGVHHHVQDPAYWNGVLGQLQNHQSMNMPPQLDPTFFDHGLAGPKSPHDKPNGSMYPQPPPPVGKIPNPHDMKPTNGMGYFQDGMPGDLQQTINTILSKAQNLGDLIGSLTSAIQTGSGNSAAAAGVPQRPVLPNQSPFQYVPQGGPLLQNGAAENAWVAAATRAQAAATTMTATQQGRPLMRSPVPNARAMLGPPPVHGGRPLLGSPVPAHKPVGFVEMKPNQFGWGPGHFLATPAPQYPAYPGPNLVPGLWSHPGSPVLVASPPIGLCTPIGQKRKYNRLLPSPEPSPEGNYIGQHSQGLGGHYADSYFKRKKKN